jgi:hypothetical protein
MAAKKARQTMEKFRREQERKRRREEKLQKREDRRIAKAERNGSEGPAAEIGRSDAQGTEAETETAPPTDAEGAP